MIIYMFGGAHFTICPNANYSINNMCLLIVDYNCNYNNYLNNLYYIIWLTFITILGILIKRGITKR